MFASLPMTDQYILIDFSHQNIYFSNRTLSSQTDEGLHKKSSASVWQQTENMNIFLYSKPKFLWLNRAKNISPPPASPRHETSLNAESNSSPPQMDQINPARDWCLVETDAPLMLSSTASCVCKLIFY